MELVTCVLMLVAVVVPLWLLSRGNAERARVAESIKELPGPLVLPFIGSAWKMMFKPRKDFFLTMDEVTRDFWPIYKTWTGKYGEVHLSEAEHVEAILRSTTNITKAYPYEFIQPWLGTGLLTSTGQKWHSRRKLITPTFHFKILENFQEVVAENSLLLVKKLEKELGNSKGFDVYPYITHCALDIICETAMGTRVNAQEDSHSPYVAAIYDISELIIGRMTKPWLHPDFLFSLTKDGRRYQECLEIVHGFTNRVIEERKKTRSSRHKPEVIDNSEDIEKKQRVAFLDLLLEASEGGARLSNEDIREEVDTFMFEGHDTTTASLCWTLFLLGLHPEVQERVFEEQREIFGDSNREPVVKDLSQMKYLERVLKESLRLYPSVPVIARCLSEDIQIGKYNLVAGVTVAVHIYHVHRNPKYFPDPEAFNPDHFLPERVHGRHPYAYIPFSAGSRNCIGQKFALLEEKTLISSVIRHFRVRSLDTRENVKLLGELVLRPEKGIRLAIERR